MGLLLRAEAEEGKAWPSWLWKLLESEECIGTVPGGGDADKSQMKLCPRAPPSVLPWCS